MPRPHSPSCNPGACSPGTWGCAKDCVEPFSTSGRRLSLFQAIRPEKSWIYLAIRTGDESSQSLNVFCRYSLRLLSIVYFRSPLLVDNFCLTELARLVYASCAQTKFTVDSLPNRTGVLEQVRHGSGCPTGEDRHA